MGLEKGFIPAGKWYPPGKPESDSDTELIVYKRASTKQSSNPVDVCEQTSNGQEMGGGNPVDQELAGKEKEVNSPEST